MTEVPTQLLINALIEQRNVAFNTAAQQQARAEHAEARIAELEAEAKGTA